AGGRRQRPERVETPPQGIVAQIRKGAAGPRTRFDFDQGGLDLDRQRVVGGDRLRRLARPLEGTRDDRGDRHVAERGREPQGIIASVRVEVCAGRAAGVFRADAVEAPVANEEEPRHCDWMAFVWPVRSSPSAASQCAANASICRSVSSKSPRKQTARSSTNTWAAGLRSVTSSTR